MSTRCSRCDGQGYHHWFGGSFSVCEKCEGSGKPMGDAPPIVREMMRVIDDLRGKMNDRATEGARAYRNAVGGDGSYKPPSGLRCGSCRGNGFNPDDSPNHWGITKCRKCNGTGVIGQTHPIIDRLWYEIDRLNGKLNEVRIEHDLKSLSNKSKYSRQTDEPKIEITDTDVWRHILGVNEGANADAVKKAYRQKAKITHSDHGGSDLDFRMIKLAYDKLMEGLSR